MGLFDRFRSPKAQAKHNLKKSLKGAKWKTDYNKALEDLGVPVKKPKNANKATANSGNYQPSFSLGSDSGGAKWPYGLSADGRTRVIDHRRMMQNARDAYHDSIDARAIIDSFADNVVDTGLLLDACPSPEMLGITPEAAESWGADTSRRFHLWAKDKKQHRSGTMTFYQAQRLYELFQQRDNDMFTRLYYSNKKTLQNPLQYEFIDPNQVRGCPSTNTYAQLDYQDGIIRNPDGTEREYKIWMTNPAKPGDFKIVDIPRVGTKSGKVMMIHGFNPEYAGQRRGYSRIGFALQELENITDLSLATIKKAINQSLMVMSVENQQQTPGNPVEDITKFLDTSATGQSLTEEPTAEEITAADNTLRACPIPEAANNTPGSWAFVGNEQGDNIRMLENKTPNESYSAFVGSFMERLCAATGNPVEVVMRKFGKNYSASRATLVLAWRTYQIWREEMAVDFLNPIYESWLSEEIAAGRIAAPGFLDPRLKAAWLNCNWIGSRMPEIDPGKTAKATKDNLEMNLTTLERESRNLNGSSAKDNIQKNIELFEIMPIPPWGNSQATNTPEEESSEEDDQSMDKEEEDDG